MSDHNSAEAGRRAPQPFFANLRNMVETHNELGFNALPEELMEVPAEPGSLILSSPLPRDWSVMLPRAVALILEPGTQDHGPKSLLLQRFSEESALEYVPQYEKVLSKPKAVFKGGDKQDGQLRAIARTTADSDVDTLPGCTRLANRLALVDVHRDEDEVLPFIEEMRVFSGYMQWAPGVLEEGVAAGEFFLAPALPQDIFRPIYFDLWAEVMRRQGATFATFSTFPADIKVYDN